MNSKWGRNPNRRFGKPRNQYDRCSRSTDDNSFMESGSSNQRHQGRGHPSHLRGRAIGMYYAQRNKGRKSQPDQVSMNVRDERTITSLLNKIQSNDIGTYSNNESSQFQVEYNRHLSSKLANDIKYNPVVNGLQPDSFLDDYLLKEQRERTHNPQYLQMQTLRGKLPTLRQEKEIVDAINSNQVVVISGETGCGKTTQELGVYMGNEYEQKVMKYQPLRKEDSESIQAQLNDLVSQFILDSFISQGKGSQCHIVCTQPRRISAITIAERVAEERAETCGGENSSVGWQIRLESKIPRGKGSILYCTTGIVLQWLKSDSQLKDVSHIILDEIHERDLDSDFLMIILKDLLQRRPDLKLILMSATLNAHMFSNYFFNCPMVHIPGYTFPVTEYYLEDILEKTGFVPESSYHAKPKWLQKREFDQEEIMGPFLRNIADSYSRRTINTLQEWNESEINMNLIVSLLRHISLKEKEGAILVFLPGWQEISKLHTLLTNDLMFQSSAFNLIPLHSMMPTVNQREVFNPPPKGVRKIVIATNIAETSITINDVVYVVDCGFIKLGNFDVSSNVATLKPEWVTEANARQRRGRAGRVQPGICFKLYTRAREMTFQKYCEPEMLRTRLETLCLKIKILKLGSIESFLAKAMNPPVTESVILSINLLTKLNALDSEESLTPLGFHLARLPLDPQTGRMILFGAIFSCLDPILTVAASLSFKDAFLTPLGKEELVDQRKRVLAQNTQSDHLMLANALQNWEEACRNGSDRDFCWRNFLSTHTLKMLSSLKKQFAEYLLDLHFLHCSDHKHRDFNRNSGNKKLLKAVICAGLYPNIAKLRHKKSTGTKQRPPTLYTDNGKVTFHPKSVLNGERLFSSSWVVYFQKIKSTRVFLHDMTVVHPYALLLFGGGLIKGHQNGFVTLSMEDWINFCCTEQVSELIPALRKELDSVLEHKINFPGVTDWKPGSKEGAILQSIVDLLSSEDDLHSPSANSFQEEEECDFEENNS